MPVFVTDEVVTAAKMNLIFKPQAAGNTDSRTFTNTSFLDLDALTGGAGTIAAVSVSVTTSTTALVIVSCGVMSCTAGTIHLSFRVSGASTVAASTSESSLRNGATTGLGASRSVFQSGLTAGVNVFELQASVSAGTGTLFNPKLIVIPI